MTEARDAGHAGGPGDCLPPEGVLWEWEATRRQVTAARVLAAVGPPVGLPLIAAGLVGVQADQWWGLVSFIVGFTLALTAVESAFRPRRCEVLRDRIVITTVFGQVRQWAPSEIGLVIATWRGVRLPRLKLWFGDADAVRLRLDEGQRDALREVLAQIGGPTAEDWLFVSRKGLLIRYEWRADPKAVEQTGTTAPPPPLTEAPLAEWVMPAEQVRFARRGPVVLGLAMLLFLPLWVLVRVGATRFWPVLWRLAAAGGAVLLLFVLLWVALWSLVVLWTFRRCAVYPDRVVLERLWGPSRELSPGDIALAELRSPGRLRLRLRSGWLGRTVSVVGYPSVMRRLFEALEQLGVPSEEAKA